MVIMLLLFVLKAGNRVLSFRRLSSSAKTFCINILKKCVLRLNQLHYVLPSAIFIIRNYQTLNKIQITRMTHCTVVAIKCDQSSEFLFAG